MATKVGRFVSKNGHTYEVKFSGDKITSSTNNLELGVPPVVISMAAGETKFEGFKTTTATVNILTDTGVVDLYAERPTDIRLTITDLTSNWVDFDGYVSPFSYDQPRTGCADVVTINAVDLLSAHKGGRYIGSSATYAETIITEICERIGVNRIVVHYSFFDSSSSTVGRMLQTAFSTSGFVQDEASDVDVVSAISKFLGYTSVVIGNTLYMYDESFVGSSTSERERYLIMTPPNGAVANALWNSSLTTIATQSLLGMAVNNQQITIERAYDGIEISPNGPEKNVILPDVCEDENVEPNGSAVVVKDGLSPLFHVEKRTPMKSKVMSIGLWQNGAVGSSPAVNSGSWSNGAVLMRVESYDYAQKIVSDTEKYVVPTSVSSKNVLWVRAAAKNDARVRVATQITPATHKGGYVALKMNFSVVADDDWKNTTKAIELDNEKVHKLRLLDIHCGVNTYGYDPESSSTGVWGSSKQAVFLIEGFKLLPTGESQKHYTSDIILKLPDSGGSVYLDISWIGSVVREAADNIFIESLSLEGWGDDINPRHADLFHSFSGKEDEMLKVDTLLTTRKSGYSDDLHVGVNARPGCAMSSEWDYRWHGGGSLSIPMAGVLMAQLKGRYGSPQRVMTMTVDQRIKPYASVLYNGSVLYTDAYDWDIYNNETTITIS